MWKVFAFLIASFSALPALAYYGDEELRLKKHQQEVSDCELHLASKKAEYEDLIAAKKYWQAAGVLRRCATVLSSTELRGLIDAAEIKEHQSVINNPKASKEEKQKAKERLVIDHPEAGKQYTKEVRSAEAVEKVKLAKVNRSKGVHLGMSPDEVLASSWGRPHRVTRSQSSNIYTETWDYGYPNFLYFVNGRLEQIHN